MIHIISFFFNQIDQLVEDVDLLAIGKLISNLDLK